MKKTVIILSALALIVAISTSCGGLRKIKNDSSKQPIIDSATVIITTTENLATEFFEAEINGTRSELNNKYWERKFQITGKVEWITYYYERVCRFRKKTKTVSARIYLDYVEKNNGLPFKIIRDSEGNRKVIEKKDFMSIPYQCDFYFPKTLSDDVKAGDTITIIGDFNFSTRMGNIIFDNCRILQNK